MASKFALVIANTEYQDASFAKLTAPGKDAEEFAQVLRMPELAAFDDVQVLLNEGEGKTRRVIARFFADRKPEDLLLLYFSGHGVRNDQGQLFLAANDTEKNILEATGIPAEFVTQAMNNSRSKKQLLILDCCNSGAFAHGSKSASGIGESMGIATAFEGDGFGRIVLTATDATQFAWEGDKVIGNTQYSVFTHFLIEGLKGEADKDGDGRIKVGELYDYAYEQVVRRTPKQTPGKWSYRQQGDLVLRDNLERPQVKPAPLPPDLVELLSYPNFSARKAGIQELMILLAGKHLGLSRAAEEKLREMAVNDASLDLRKTASDALIAHGLTVEAPVPTAAKVSPEIRGKFPVGPHDPPFQEKENTEVYSSTLRPWAAIVGGFLILILSIWLSLRLYNNLPNSAPEPTSTIQTSASATVTFQSEQTNTPSPTRTPSTPTPSVKYEIGSTLVSEKDNMTLVYVPDGEFTMGIENSNDALSHTVYLDAFWIDSTEITNKMYAICVGAGNCESPKETDSATAIYYYDSVQFENFPVIQVDWNMAKTYCEWADRRLPTEAEWEKAARGSDERLYPWGEEIDCSKANYDGELESQNCGGRGTTRAGSYEVGKSPYGAYDMTGNVWEWVSSLYLPYPYDATDGREDLSSLGNRGIRGGAWYNRSDSVFVSARGAQQPTHTDDGVGFRCALTATP